MRYNQYRSKRLDLLLGGKLATALFCAVILLTSAASSSAQPRWREFATLRYARHAHAVCRLGDDSLIVIGGYNGSFGLLDGYPIERTEIIDLKTGSVSDGPIMVRGRAEFATVTLPDGDILVFGGYVWSGGVFNGIERLDVQTLTWS